MDSITNRAPALDASSRWAAGMLLFVNIAFALYALSQRLGFAEILLVYWAETVVIAVINVPKILLVGLFFRPIETLGQLQRSAQRFAGVAALLLGYVVVMSIVCMLLFVAIFVLPATLGWADQAAGFQVADDPGQSLRAFGLVVAALAVSHLVSFAVNFLWRREFRGGSLLQLVAQPALRIVGIVLVMIGALGIALAQPWIGKTQGFAIVIILVKIGVDLRAHLAERRRFGNAEARIHG